MVRELKVQEFLFTKLGTVVKGLGGDGRSSGEG
jgi:hypothetical protein